MTRRISKENTAAFGVCGRNILLIISLHLSIAYRLGRYCTVFYPNSRMIHSEEQKQKWVLLFAVMTTREFSKPEAIPPSPTTDNGCIMYNTRFLLKILVHADTEIACSSLANGSIRVCNAAFVVNFPHVLTVVHSVSRWGRHDDATVPSPVLSGLGRVDQDGIGELSGKLRSGFDGGDHVVLSWESFVMVWNRALRDGCQQNLWEQRMCFFLRGSLKE
jgi:hypothetical protein